MVALNLLKINISNFTHFCEITNDLCKGWVFMNEKILIKDIETCNEESAISMGAWSDEEFWR